MSELNHNTIDTEEAVGLALISCVIIKEDLLGGTVFQTFDRAYDLAEEFYHLNKDTDWEQSDIDFDEAIIQFTNKKLKNI